MIRVRRASIGLPLSSLRLILRSMEASPFEEKQFFRAIDRSAARAILIGRRALIALLLASLDTGL
ncbi:MAG: hypothetical protein DMG14_29640 [Acidobacteria bacterium]|nr:MAG: hypothetical protein DMG14_29640 [Acidobacteriota bacterium]